MGRPLFSSAREPCPSLRDEVLGQIPAFASVAPLDTGMYVDPRGAHGGDRRTNVSGVEPTGQEDRPRRQLYQATAHRPVVGFARCAARTGGAVVRVGDEGIDPRREARHLIRQLIAIVGTYDQALHDTESRPLLA